MKSTSPRLARIGLALILLLQLLVLSALGVMILRRDRNPIVIEAGSEYWYSGTVKGYAPGQPMRIDEDSLNAPFDALAAQEVTAGETEGTVIAFFGPLTDLARSGYTISVEYSAGQEQTLRCRSALPAQLRSGTALLPPGDHVQAELEVLAFFPAEDFRLEAEYNGRGPLELHAVTIRSNSRLQRMELILLLFAFLLMDAAWLFRRELSKHRMTLLGLLGIILFTSLPVMADFLGQGHDLRFHLLRIEALYQGLTAGQLPVRTAPLYYGGLGYAAPIFYCDLLLMFPAVLRIMGFPVMMAYQGYLLFINTLTALIGYGCFRALLKDRSAAMLADLCWCTASYRFSNLYIRAAVGEYSAMAFLPLILLAFLRIYDENDRHTLLQNAVLMASGMAMLVMTHILTLEIVCLILAVLVLVRFRRTFTRRVLLTWLTAAGLTVLLSLWFLLPFLEYYLSVPVLISLPVADSLKLMQERGSTVTDLFDFFRDAYTLTVTDSGRDLLMTPGPAAMAALLLGMVQWARGKAARQARGLVILSCALLFMSTNLFPWNAIAMTPLGNLLGTLQFPWRLLTVVCVLLALLAGQLLTSLRADAPQDARRLGAAAAAVCVMTACFCSGTFNTHAQPYRPFSTADLSSSWTSSAEYKRYLPLYAEYETFGLKEEKRGDAVIHAVRRDGDAVTLRITASEESTVDFPRFNYLHDQVTDSAGHSYAISDSESCCIRVVVPAGFDGELTARLAVPLSWRLAEAVSILTLAALLLMLFRQRRHGALKNHGFAA